MCSPSSHRLIPSLHSCYLILHFSLQFYNLPFFITFCVNSFPLISLSHYPNNDSLFSLSLPFMPLVDGLSHSSETIFSAKQSQGHTAVLLQTRPWVWESWIPGLQVTLGHLGNPELFFSWCEKLSADSQGRNLRWPLEHLGLKCEQPGQSPRGRLRPG